MTRSAVNPPGQLLVIGGGYTGQRFAQAAQSRFCMPVLLTSRQAKAAPGPTQPGFHWLAHKIVLLSTLMQLHLFQKMVRTLTNLYHYSS